MARRLIGDDLIRAIRRGGWDYDLVDDDALAMLPTDWTRPMIIAGASALPAEVQAWFEAYAAGGGVVLVVDSAVEIAGATTCARADLADTLAASCPPAVRLDPPTLRHSKGGDPLEPPESEMGVVHRQTSAADVYLVINTGPSLQSTMLTPRAARGWYEEWDAHTGAVVRAGRLDAGIDLRLHPYQATVIVLSDHEPQTPPDRDQRRPQRLVLEDGWQVQFADREVSVAVDLPHVWESEEGRAAFSGSATYRTTVDLGELGPTPRIHLDLGAAAVAVTDSVEPAGLLGHSFRASIEPPVGVIAEVRVNGVDCGTVWSPPYVVDVTRAALSGPNRVEIVVANTAAKAGGLRTNRSGWAA